MVKLKSTHFITLTVVSAPMMIAGHRQPRHVFSAAPGLSNYQTCESEKSLRGCLCRAIVAGAETTVRIIVDFSQAHLQQNRDQNGGEH